MIAFTPADEEEKLAAELAKKLLLDAILERSSDVHIAPQRSDTVIKYRIDGVLREISRQSHQTMASLTRVVKKMAAMNPDVTDAPQDGRLLLATPQPGHFDLRLGILPTYFGENVTIRILDAARADSVLEGGLEAAGFEGQDLTYVRTMLHQPYGLVLFTGPTGCGKTSSIYASLSEMVREFKGRSSIMTLEDPVEVLVDGIIQTPVQSEGEFNYVRGIKAVLRHDLDVLYCGEIQNPETAQLLVQVALTGHLVISQLHATDVPHALKILSDIGPEPYLTGMALAGIVAQRLVRQALPALQGRAGHSPELLARLGDDADRLRITWRAQGCDACKQTGYLGRTTICEAVPRDERLSDMLSSRLAVGDLQNAVRQLGYPSLKQSAMAKVTAGITSLEEAIRTTC